MSKVLKAIVHEIREILPAFTFFAVAFELIVFTDTLTTEQYGVRPFHIVGGLVLALMVAKGLLLADLMPFVDAFPEKPLIYNTLWKSLLYTVFTMVLIFLEHLIDFGTRYGSLSSGFRHMVSDASWPQFWAVRIWMVVMLIVFTAFQELDRKLGHSKLRQMFFGR